MTYPYYKITGNPLIDSLYARPDHVANPAPSWVLPIAVIGAIIGAIVGLQVSK